MTDEPIPDHVAASRLAFLSQLKERKAYADKMKERSRFCGPHNLRTESAENIRDIANELCRVWCCDEWSTPVVNLRRIADRLDTLVMKSRAATSEALNPPNTAPWPNIMPFVDFCDVVCDHLHANMLRRGYRLRRKDEIAPDETLHVLADIRKLYTKDSE